MIEDTKKLMEGCAIPIEPAIVEAKYPEDYLICGFTKIGDFIQYCPECLARIDEAKKRIKEWRKDIAKDVEEVLQECRYLGELKPSDNLRKIKIEQSDRIYRIIVNKLTIKYNKLEEELKILEGGKER